jgi:hypothetical protein
MLAKSCTHLRCWGTAKSTSDLASRLQRQQGLKHSRIFAPSRRTLQPSSPGQQNDRYAQGQDDVAGALHTNMHTQGSVYVSESSWLVKMRHNSCKH